MEDKDKELLDYFLNSDPEKITATEQQYQKLREILDHEPEPNEKLREILAKKAPWEKFSDDFSREQPTDVQERESMD